MATEVPSQDELFTLFQNEVQNRQPNLNDFRPGSNLDAIGGGTSVVGQEMVSLVVKQFAKTFVETSNGPAITGGPDDLQSLLTDHFGESFERPGATKSTTTVDFSRPNTDAGDVTILQGTFVKTEKAADGTEQRFATLSEVVMTGTAISASVEAVIGGAAGNVLSGTISVIETALTDATVVVTNPLAAVGGDDDFDDSEYREFARNQIEVIRGATKAAVEAAANNVPGVETATVIEDLQTVIEFDIGSSSTVGDFFFIPRARLFIADINGTASQALIDAVIAAVFTVRACGVEKIVLAAVALAIDWKASITLNPSGPNFAEFSTDTTRIEETMVQYIQDLPIGTGFDRGLARLAILAIWGPTGTDDLTDFLTNEPVGDIATSTTQKLIPGTVEAS